ncbi:UDP-3-O-acyl-N-acetylglucosamine deacetylase [Roseomonas marmotae]|uniref:UDP-3-O-acyl-N-acetylglucosamine deacetylase n=1 Tax=Roseomonas marmotae TaxID=2768161 RepID=A0ABS3KBG4_9PROT|nr:UDP-3-O-acyl-N-acetylglucosamine deacetylase [Roseomonas marmotae]MBO1074812.1 UDP-3-O-acyl-N-acetylglucosamine deacetylase [Roseomonas marmotae]QTI80680.1 UDP-3-O-acyl-N-acetylglucosamine deacetylase [Roseomonas marmotae]
MDGSLTVQTGRRKTLKAPIGCVGIGLHSGQRVSLTLRPAPSGHGIVFRRTDLGLDLPARYDWVGDTRLCTALVMPGRPEVRVGTVEHVMAALSACGIDDVLIELNGPEVPIMDGSAAPFLFLIDCAGTVESLEARSRIEVLKTVRVQDGEGPGAAWAELSPNPTPGLEAQLAIDFAGTAIGRQTMATLVTENAFRALLADARTFTLAADIERLRAAGLALGGSLSNAVVVDGTTVLNPGGLRHSDEFVRHKLLDVVGDLAMAGAPLRGRFRGERSGHALNNRLLRALLADPAAWRWEQNDALALSVSQPALRETVAA